MDAAAAKELEISLMAITLESDGDVAKAKKAIHGKTVGQVIDYANSLK
jgi:hypothetical protein